ncbi:hypothetical protein SynA1562_01600 [Synechococcus sp. A15-62]|nr:hypothetical protein SynA1562_01600 [Synechococcus sp. A15-62]
MPCAERAPLCFHLSGLSQKAFSSFQPWLQALLNSFLLSLWL